MRRTSSSPRGYVYTRASNPTRAALERSIAALEGGAEAFAFSSGSAASLAVLSLLRAGDHVIAPLDCHHGTAVQLRELLARWGVCSSFVDTTRTGEIEAAFEASTRLVCSDRPRTAPIW